MPYQVKQTSEKTWLATRRNDIDKLVVGAAKRKHSAISIDAQAKGQNQHSDEISREHEKLEIKAKIRLIEAAQAKHLLPSERTASVDEDALIAQNLQDKREREHQKHEVKVK